MKQWWGEDVCEMEPSERNLGTAAGGQVAVGRRFHFLAMADRRMITTNALEGPVVQC
jgi:hypothetical protein